MCNSFWPEICHYFLETTLTAILDSATEVEPLPTSAPAASAAPADCSSNSPVTGEVTAEIEEDLGEDKLPLHSQAKAEEMVVVSDKIEEQKKMQDEEDKETGAPAAETGTVYLIWFEFEPWGTDVP